MDLRKMKGLMMVALATMIVMYPWTLSWAGEDIIIYDEHGKITGLVSRDGIIRDKNFVIRGFIVGDRLYDENFRPRGAELPRVISC